MIPILVWFIRKGENVIQFWFHVRTLPKFSSRGEEGGKGIHFLESIVVIHQQSQIPGIPKVFKEKLKVVFGLILSKTYFFGLLFFWIYGLDRIVTQGYRCRHLKDGAEFLLRNETEPAKDLNMNFTQIYEVRKENANGINWQADFV